MQLAKGAKPVSAAMAEHPLKVLQCGWMSRADVGYAGVQAVPGGPQGHPRWQVRFDPAGSLSFGVLCQDVKQGRSGRRS
eukprot:2408852-Rhodomonas_salina.6